MFESTILDLVQQRAESLAAEQLRSVSIAIARLEDVIGEANRLGHSHKVIHARIEAAGIDASWNSYRVALVRARKKSGRTGAKPTDKPKQTSEPESRPDAQPKSSAELRITEVSVFGPDAPSPTRVLDALLSAKQTAARDYSQIARSLHRKIRK
jgi:hypothetical protein